MQKPSSDSERTSRITFKSPKEVEELGFEAQPLETLETLEENKIWVKVLNKWIERLPGLRTPRQPDGSGGLPPKEHQLRHASIALCRKHNMLSWTMGSGKCHGLGTEILMFDGSIKKVEDIVVGDQLMGPDSKPRNVLSLARGREEMYEVTSTKGDKYTVNESHILSLKRSGTSHSGARRTDKWKTGDVVNIELRDFLKLGTHLRKETYKQYKVGVEFPEQSVPLDPYFLGLWLGDGSSTGPSVTTMDEVIREYVRDIATANNLSITKSTKEGNKSSTYCITRGNNRNKVNTLLETMRSLNLIRNKHVPAIYKLNSREIRLQVLAGLLDTDGHLSNGKSSYEITQKNKQVSDDIIFLARSLGFAAYQKKVKKYCWHKGEKKTGTYYKVSIWGNTEEIPVRLEHKKATLRSNFKDSLVAGIDIKSIGYGDYYGFTLDGDHLYLLANFVVTHNTGTSLITMLGWFGEELFAGRVKPGTIHIVAPRHVLRQVWIREMQRIGIDQFAEVITTESQLMHSKAPIFIYHFDFPKMQTDKGREMRRAGGGQRLRQNGTTFFLGHPIAKVINKHRAPSFLIVDEIHKIKKGTERTRCMEIVRKKAKRVLGLTGTPMDGWVQDAATILGFIYGQESKAYPFTNEHFSKKYTCSQVVSTDIATGQETVGKERPVPGINHMQIPSFVKTTRHLMHRLNLMDPEVKANVVYPPERPTEVVIDMDPEHLAFYQSLHQEKASQADRELQKQQSLASLKRNVLALINDLRLASKVPHALGYTGKQTALIDTVISIVKHHAAEGRKGLIGTTFIQESRLIHEALAKAGIKGVRIYANDKEANEASMSKDKREEMLEQFQEDPECMYLISNKELVAEGLNLAESASYTISCSHGWRANIETQWLSRVVRPGQVWPWVNTYTLVNRNTIDHYIYQFIRAKIAATIGMLDLDFSYGDDSISTEIDPLKLAHLLTESQ